MVIEALCGADYDELIEDYFITYHNYYGIEKGTENIMSLKKCILMRWLDSSFISIRPPIFSPLTTIVESMITYLQ